MATAKKSQGVQDRVISFFDFLNHNKLVTVLLFVLLLFMMMMDTSVTAFGFKFGFTSTPSCPEQTAGNPAVAPTTVAPLTTSPAVPSAAP